MSLCTLYCLYFFFNDTATTEIYTLSLHDALPIWERLSVRGVELLHALLHEDRKRDGRDDKRQDAVAYHRIHHQRSEEHTSELQSRLHLVCRLLLEKKKKVSDYDQLFRCHLYRLYV